MGVDRLLRGDEAAIALPEPDMALGQLEGREAPDDLPAVEKLMLETVVEAGLQRGFDRSAAFRREIERAGDMQELHAGLRPGLLPQFMRAPDDRHVMRALEIGEPDDPGQAVRRAHRVADVEALQPEHLQAALGKVPAGGGPHGADTGNDDVIAVVAHGRELGPAEVTAQAIQAAPMPVHGLRGRPGARLAPVKLC